MPRQYITVRSITLHRKMLCSRKCIQHCMMCVAPGNAFAWGKYFVPENVFHQEVRYPRLCFTPGYAFHQNVNWTRMCNAPRKNALLMNFFAAGIAPHQEMYSTRQDVHCTRKCYATGYTLYQGRMLRQKLAWTRKCFAPGTVLHEEVCCYTRLCFAQDCALNFALGNEFHQKMHFIWKCVQFECGSIC